MSWFNRKKTPEIPPVPSPSAQPPPGGRYGGNSPAPAYHGGPPGGGPPGSRYGGGPPPQGGGYGPPQGGRYGPPQGGGYGPPQGGPGGYGPPQGGPPPPGYGAGGGGYNQRLDPDSARRDLFAGAKAPSQKFGSNWDKDPSEHDNSNGYDDGGEGSGINQQQQDEDDEVEAVKQQMRFTKQESLASTRNALRIAQEAEMTAQGTLSKLGEQSERIGNADRNLDLAKAHNLRAEDEAKEIKALNRSIFRPNFQFNKQAKRDAEEAKILNRHMDEKQEREKNRRDLEDSRKRIGGAFENMEKSGGGRYGSSYGQKGGAGGPAGGQRQRNLAERSRYQFESTNSDDEVEDEIDDNLDLLGGAVGRLNILAKAQNSEVVAQNKKLENVSGKTDMLDNEVVRNTERLKRIK